MKPWLLSIVLLSCSLCAFAQSGRSKDFGVIASAEVSVGVGRRFDVSLEEELRFNNNCAQFDRWLNSLSVECKFLHNRLKLGLTGDYIRRHNDKNYFENRFRAGAQVTYSESIYNFKFSLRSKLIATFRDETIGDYRVNPKLYWRNRLQISYQRPNSRFKYSLSTELHWLINDPKNCIVDNLRTVLAVDYLVARHHTVSLFARMDNDLQVNQPVDRFYLGATWKLKY